jgi:hypothetical protein
VTCAGEPAQNKTFVGASTHYFGSFEQYHFAISNCACTVIHLSQNHPFEMVLLMGALMICCPANGKKLAVGDVDPIAFEAAADSVATVYCPYCQTDHQWVSGGRLVRF